MEDIEITDTTARNRRWRWTFFNYTDAHIEAIKAIDCQYLIFGKEKCPTTGKLHLQGFHVYKNAVFFSSVIKALGIKKHGKIFQCSKTTLSNINYCKKIDQVPACEPNEEVFEKGTPPVSVQQQAHNQRELYKTALDQARSGNFDEIDPVLYTRYKRTYESVRHDSLKKIKLEDTTELHLWYWGKTRTGKSRKARTENPGFYVKSCSKWWCDYQREEVVLIEDIDKSHGYMLQDLKLWTDRYPFKAEVKGGNLGLIRPKRFVITSNHHPSDIFSGVDLEAIMARLEITHFT